MSPFVAVSLLEQAFKDYIARRNKIYCSQSNQHARFCTVIDNVAEGSAKAIVKAIPNTLLKSVEECFMVYRLYVAVTASAYEKGFQIPKEYTYQFISGIETVSVSAFAWTFSKARSNLLRSRSLKTRTAKLLSEDTGFNFMTKRSALRYRYYRSKGTGGTFVTDRRQMAEIFGTIPENVTRLEITASQATRVERMLGLPAGSAKQGGTLSIVEKISQRNPRIPKRGNAHFKGEGKGLPSGGPEVEISPIQTAGGAHIRQIDVVVVKRMLS